MKILQCHTIKIIPFASTLVTSGLKHFPEHNLLHKAEIFKLLFLIPVAKRSFKRKEGPPNRNRQTLTTQPESQPLNGYPRKAESHS